MNTPHPASSNLGKLSLNPNDLRYCLAVAEAGTLRGAADRLRTSHTTVSRRVTAMEQRLGTRLFDRLPSGFRATEAGERVIDTARIVFGELEALERGLAGEEASLSGPVRVTMPDILGLWLMPALASFSKAWPGIELELLSSYTVLRLDRREADIALRFMPVGVMPQEEQLVGRKLAGIAYGNYATRSWLSEHRLDGSDPGAAWIGWTDGGPFPDWVRRSEFPNVPARGLMTNASLQVAAARSGMGLAQLPCSLADPLPDLVRVGSRAPELEFDLWMLVHPDLRRTARLRVFRDFVANAALEAKELLEGRGLPAVS